MVVGQTAGFRACGAVLDEDGDQPVPGLTVQASFGRRDHAQWPAALLLARGEAAVGRHSPMGTIGSPVRRASSARRSRRQPGPGCRARPRPPPRGDAHVVEAVAPDHVELGAPLGRTCLVVLVVRHVGRPVLVLVHGVEHPDRVRHRRGHEPGRTVATQVQQPVGGPGRHERPQVGQGFGPSDIHSWSQVRIRPSARGRHAAAPNPPPEPAPKGAAESPRCRHTDRAGGNWTCAAPLQPCTAFAMARSGHWSGAGGAAAGPSRVGSQAAAHRDSATAAV